MPRRKNPKSETIDEVVEEISTAENSFNEEINNIFGDEKSEKVEPQNDNNDLEKKRDELLKLAEDGDLDKSVSYIKKASHKVINKLYTEYVCKRMQKANVFLTDMVISKFCSTLGGFEAIESPKELYKELDKDELLKRDVNSIIEKITAYIPFLGFLSGCITTAKHVYGHKTNHQDETNNEDETEN